MMVALVEQPSPVVVLADGRDGASAGPSPTRRALVRFGVGTLLALIIVTLTAVVVARRAAEREAKFDVRRVTEVLGLTIVETNLDDDFMRGDPAARARMDRVVQRRVLAGTALRRIKLWTPDGRVIYSDDPRAIGQQVPLSARQIDAVETGRSTAQVSDLAKPENVTEGELGSRLLEVYSGVRTDSGRPLMLEAYYSYDVAIGRRSGLLRSILFIGLVALASFLMIQLCVGGFALRWLRQQHRRLLDASARAAERERSRIASGLHDGMVQDLVGASYALASAAEMARRKRRGEIADALDPAAKTLRTSIQGLRSMIVDIYPTAVHRAGLAVALTDLVASAKTRGLTVDVDVARDLSLPVHVEETLYRCALEASRNVLAHASAQRLRLQVRCVDATAELVVSDDGVGFDPLAQVAPGRVGLRVMADLVRDAGGLLHVLASSGTGTILTVQLPLAGKCGPAKRRGLAVFRGRTSHDGVTRDPEGLPRQTRGLRPLSPVAAPRPTEGARETV
jgi:two-component system, NarL family, sensor kinase